MKTAPRQEILAEIFRDHGEAVRCSLALTPRQNKVLGKLQHCRTAALGGRLYVCDNCRQRIVVYNSCRDRHCPTCQSAQQARWIRERMERVLPTSHFHVVFTLPSSLRQLVFGNQKALYGLLFKSASKTLQELAGDEAWLGAQLGITAVLHTWTRTLAYHPHLHCLVTGGGLAPDGKSWLSARGGGRYLFPVRVLSRLFRGKFLAGLIELRRKGELHFSGPTEHLEGAEDFGRFKDKLYRSEWVVYAKRPFAGPAQIFRYLGRYTHRVAISPQRIVEYDGARLRFRTKGVNELSLRGEAFVRRFLLHVLPTRFVKIRHYGLYAPCNIRTKLEGARSLLKKESKEAEVEADLSDLDDFLDRDSPPACPNCEVGVLSCLATFRPGANLDLTQLPEPFT